MLIPEIVVERGQNYTFKIQTGDNTNNQAEYHPVYITNDDVGGYAQRDPADKAVSDKYFCFEIGEIDPKRWLHFAKSINV